MSYSFTKTNSLIRFIFVTAVWLIAGGFMMLSAQDAPVTRIGTVNTTASSAVVSVTATNFSNIGSCDLRILYDQAIAIPTDVTLGSGVVGDVNANLANPGIIRIGWYASPCLTLPGSPVIFNIHFSKVVNGTTSLTFNYSHNSGKSCQYYCGTTSFIDDPHENFYIDGSLSFSDAADAPVTILPLVTACPGTSIIVPVKVSGFNHIGVVSLEMNYDPAVLTWISGSNTAGFTGLAAISGTIPGKVRIGGNNSLTQGFTIPDGNTFVTLNFTYLGGTTTLIWNDDPEWNCEYATPATLPDYLVLNDDPAGNFYISGSVSMSGNTNAGTVSGTSPLCAGSTAVYTSSGTTGGTWGSSNPAVATVNTTSGLVTALTAGTTTITYSVASDCGGNLISTRLLTVSAPLYGGTASATPSQVCQGTGATLTLAGHTGSIQWQQSANGSTGWGDVTGGSGATTAVYTTPALMAPVWYRAKVTGSGCPDVYSNAVAITLKSCGGVYLKTFLQGAYNPSTHGMRTDLNTGGWLPVTQPYASAKPAYSGTESVTPPFNAAVVDWVIVELRTGTAAGTKVARQAALLINNGNIVGSDQVNPPSFTGITPGNYYVVVYHRNHFPVMTATAVAIPNTSETRYDFTVTPSISVFGGTNGVIRLETGVYGQVAGDINRDNLLRYSGANNDRGVIFARITAMNTPPVVLNANAHGYFTEDLNMNSWVLYSGAGNDQAIIFAGIDYFTDPTYLVSVYSGVVPVDY